ncbi:hypothetical protein DPMN_154620 [Dreissena polymorpha]|uniref:Uncharacterized protein n=1 Tax=Dreissena polymorpha TaxID=45954 RepID=A0A9D4J5W5_DREPO|nr:hypothetical protein DPMN_154620 [Dreissena polymorpha]
MQFVKESPSYPYGYTTFRTSIPKQVKKMNLTDRRLCVCLKCFNMEKKLRPINRLASLCKLDPMTLRGFYKTSVCDFETFPYPECADRSYEKCKDILSTRYDTMLKEHGSSNLKYVQWE